MPWESKYSFEYMNVTYEVDFAKGASVEGTDFGLDTATICVLENGNFMLMESKASNQYALVEYSHDKLEQVNDLVQID